MEIVMRRSRLCTPDMSSKRASIPTQAPATSASKEEVVVKPYLNDIFRCGECDMQFYNLDDFVDHKNEKCQASKVKPSSDMTSKKGSIRREKSQAPSTSAGEEEVVVKRYLSDILRCGSCKIIFFKIDDFVAHKSEKCQASKVKLSSDNIKKCKPSKKSSYDDYKKDYQSNSFNLEKKCSDIYCLKKPEKHGNNYIGIKIKEPPEEKDGQLICGICENCLKTEDGDECKLCLIKIKEECEVTKSRMFVGMQDRTMFEVGGNEQKAVMKTTAKVKAIRHSVGRMRGCSGGDVVRRFNETKSTPEFIMTIGERVKFKRSNQKSTPIKNFKKPANKPIEQFIVVKESASIEKPIVDHIDKRDDKKIKNDVSEKNFRETEDEVFSPLAVSKQPGSAILSQSCIKVEQPCDFADDSYLKTDIPGASSVTPCDSVRKSFTWKPIDLNTSDTPGAIKENLSRTPEEVKYIVPRRSARIAQRQSAILGDSRLNIVGLVYSAGIPRHSSRRNLTKLIDLNTLDTQGNLQCRKKRGALNIDCTQDPSWQPVVVLERIMQDCFYDDAIFRRARNYSPQVSSPESIINGPLSAITFHSSVVCKRITQEGDVHFLLHWSPENIVPDTWVSDDELCYNRLKRIAVSQLPPEALQLPALDVLGISPRIEKHKRK